MELSELLFGLSHVNKNEFSDLSITSATDDSRKVKKGSLFVAIKGIKADGHVFIPDAIKKGAVAVIGEISPKKDWLKKVAYLKVKDSRKALAIIASNWNNNPSGKLKIIGITGTKGKTTTSEFLHTILEKSGLKVGLINSIHAKIGAKKYDTGLHVTNPEPLILHKFLREIVNAGCKYAILEVTSHGIDQKRVFGIDFEICILTNVSHEHLDYHKTFGEYRKTKTEIFKKCKLAILNKDDKSYEIFKKATSKSSKVISYSLVSKSDYKVTDISENDTTIFSVKSKRNAYNFITHIYGNFNVLNCLAAIVTANYLGISRADIENSVSGLRLPQGRLEKIVNKKGLDIHIDFAHTPDSLEKTLHYLKKKSEKRLIAIFGCAGERYIKKRPMMGKISASLADISIFTAEDPRSEDVNKIINQIAKGAKTSPAEEIGYNCSDESIHRYKGKHVYFRVPERGEAISFTIQKLAEKGDTIVICGKGHEKSMAYNGIEYPWSDHLAVKLALNGKVKIIKR